tara:strand:- start:1254 stop:1424 length:171 start_codon:yes stop_codon:yes gene_type:complete
MKPGSLVKHEQLHLVGVLVSISAKSIFDGDRLCKVLWSNSHTTDKVMSSSLKVIAP